MVIKAGRNPSQGKHEHTGYRKTTERMIAGLHFTAGFCVAQIDFKAGDEGTATLPADAGALLRSLMTAVPIENSIRPRPYRISHPRGTPA